MMEKLKTTMAYAAAGYLQVIAWFQNPGFALSFEQWMAAIVAIPTGLHMCLKCYEVIRNLNKKQHEKTDRPV